MSKGTDGERCPTCGSDDPDWDVVQRASTGIQRRDPKLHPFPCPDPFHNPTDEGDTDGLTPGQKYWGDRYIAGPPPRDPNHDYWQARAEARLAALIEVRDWARESAASPDFDPPARGAYRSVASKLSEKIDSLPTDGLGGEEK